MQPTIDLVGHLIKLGGHNELFMSVTIILKTPSRQLCVDNHRARVGCQQSVQGNSGVIIGASIWLAIAADHFGHLANMHRKRRSYF